MKEACTVRIVYYLKIMKERKYNNQLLIIFVERIDICRTRTNCFAIDAKQINLQSIILNSAKASIKAILFFSIDP